MNHKIINTGGDFPEVLLYVDLLDNENDVQWDCVIIQAIGQTEQDYDKLVFERINFPDRNMCRSFIADYSLESAKAFYEERDIMIKHPNFKDEE